MSHRRSARRHCVAIGLAALAFVFVLGIAGPGAATSFGAFGTSPLAVSAVKTAFVGETFSVDVGFILDPGDSISSYSMSVMFDTDLGNELKLISATQPSLVTSPFGGPLTTTGTIVSVDSTGSSAGSIISFRGSTTPGSGITNPTASPIDILIGTITFETNGSLATDGPDAFTGFFDAGDHLDENSGAPHPHLSFGDLSVNIVPEPGTAGLLTLGLVALGLRSTRAPRRAD